MLTHHITAGIGAYIFAKREINADRHAKLEQSRKRKEDIRSMEYGDNVPVRPLHAAPTGGGHAGAGAGAPARDDSTGSPSQELGGDPAPTRHAPTTEQQRVSEKSKFEPETPYKSRKGDRFS